MNSANYESYTDPNGGEWVRLNKGTAKDVVWRPMDIKLTEDNQFSFDVEFLTGPGTAAVTEENMDQVSSLINGIMKEMLAYEQAQIEMISEQYEEKDEVKNVDDEILAHLEKQEVLEGGHKVSEAMLPQEMQADLAQISSVLGGLAPK